MRKCYCGQLPDGPCTRSRCIAVQGDDSAYDARQKGGYCGYSTPPRDLGTSRDPLFVETRKRLMENRNRKLDEYGVL